MFFAKIPPTIILIYILYLSILTTWLASRAALSAETLYKIPNPFSDKDNGSGSSESTDNFYAIYSTQYSSHGGKGKSRVDVEEYFSLKSGLSFSWHRNVAKGGGSFILIGDGPRSRAYIVRNPEEVADGKELVDCELDHLHSHKQVFPWQFVFDVQLPEQKTNSSGDEEMDRKMSKSEKKKMKKFRKKLDKWSSKRFVYGVGAIWLNAIERSLVSSQVGVQSPEPDANLWVMLESDLEVRLLFERPGESGSDEQQSDDEMRKLVAGSRLKRVELHRKQALEPVHELDGSALMEESSERIEVHTFHKQLDASDATIVNFFYQLSECRRQTKTHRLFPSLIRSLSESPERAYAFEYVEQHFGRMRREQEAAGSGLNERYHRRLRDIERRSEWFSFKREAQVQVYESAQAPEFTPTQREGGGDYFAGLEPDEMADVFIKRFTGREGERSSRHSTLEYHVVERAGYVESCRVGERDPPPDWFKLLARPIHFQRANGNRITGLMTGLGALLMNAADLHYKEFSMFKQELDILYDPQNLQARRRVQVNEWQFYCSKSGRTVHFYFHDKDDDDLTVNELNLNGTSTTNKRRSRRLPPQQEVVDLVRVDVRDASTSGNERPADQEDESDLLLRFELLSLELDRSSSELDFMLTPPNECFASGGSKPSGDTDSGKDESYNEEEEAENYELDQEEDENSYPKYEADESEPEESDKPQSEGEDFEFEPGKLMESFSFPDFYEFFEGGDQYEIESTIQLIEEDDDEEKRGENTKRKKFIKLRELVDLNGGLAMYKVYYSPKGKTTYKLAANMTIYVNYNSDFMFQAGYLEESCSVVEQPPTWLRLLSTDNYHYIKRQNGNLIEREDSNRLRLFGVGALWRQASGSEYTQFQGMHKDNIELEGAHFRRVSWVFNDDADSDLQVEFNFLWNMTEHNLDLAMGKKRRPTIELLHLDHISLLPDPVITYASQSNNQRDPAIGDLEPQATKFKSLDINDLGTRENWPKEGIRLPDSCARALEDWIKRDTNNQPQTQIETQLPSFWDFVKQTQQYSASYTVTHAPRLDPLAKVQNQTISQTSITESFFLPAKLGKITTEAKQQQPRREIYIDGQQKLMYNYVAERGQCQQIASLPGLVDSSSGFQAPNENFDWDQLYGLAGLWLQLTKLGQRYLLKIGSRVDSEGNRLEVRTYRLAEDVAPQVTQRAAGRASNAERVAYSVQVTFVASLERRTETNHEFSLESIDFMPRYKRAFTGLKPLYRTIVHVHSFTNNQAQKKYPKQEWRLPDECANLHKDRGKTVDGNDKDSKPKTTLQFPRLSKLIEGRGQFYMRSELASSMPKLQQHGTQLYMMNEWLRDGDIRLKTTGRQQKELDVLVYAKTKESFDLSSPFQCSSSLPLIERPPAGRDLIRASTFLDFWAKSLKQVDAPSLLYYGPLSLWRLAELNSDQVKLVSSVDLAPMTDDNDGKNTDKSLNYQSRLSRELETEVWRLESADFGQWSYDLEFKRMSAISKKDNSTKISWSVLQKVVISQTIGSDASFETQRWVEVDILNYRYRLSDLEQAQVFSIPEGYMCQRSEELLSSWFTSLDELDLNWALGHSLWYEATLEIIEEGDNSTKTAPNQLIDLNNESIMEINRLVEKRKIFSTIRGKFSSFTALPAIDVSAQFERSHYVSNNSQTSHRRVHDRTSGLLYTEDRFSGRCKVERQLGEGQHGGQDHLWTMRFEGPKGEEILIMNDEMLELLFTGSSGYFRPGNRYTEAETEVRTYEWAVNELPVRFPTYIMDGPATIIRRYQVNRMATDQWATRGNKSVNLHNSMSVKVLLFDKYSEGPKIKGILSIALREASNVGLNHILQDSLVADCYANDEFGASEARSFAIEYLVPQRGRTGREPASSTYAQWMDDFLVKLIKMSPQLQVERFERLPRIEFIQNKAITVSFSLMNAAPRATEFANKTFEGWRMTDQLESLAEESLVSSLLDCSNWCQQVGCIAMDYCSYRTCRVITPEMLCSSPDGAHLTEAIDPFKPQLRVYDPLCSFYLWTEPKPQSLDSFSRSMDMMINKRRDPFELRRLSLNLGEELDHHSAIPLRFYELKDTLDPMDEDTSLKQREVSFKTLWHNQNLDTVKLEEILKEETDFSFTMDHTKSHFECLSLCQNNPNCAIASHSRSTTLCHLVSGKGDLKKLEPALVSQAKWDGCSVSIRDYLPSYTKFELTTAPDSYELELANYSPLECAYLCNAHDGTYQLEEIDFKCLSFDACSSPSSGFTCYLRQMHVMLDSFDRSILSANNETLEEKKLKSGESKQCDHYSKSTLADFRRLPNKQLPGNGQRLIRGRSPERCALDCHEDELCWGFEYCLDDQQHPTQSCNFVLMGTGEGRNDDSSDETKPVTGTRGLEKQLNQSDKCTVFALSHDIEQFRLSKNQRTLSLVDQMKLQVGPSTLLTLVSIGALSLIVGSLIQLVYIKVVGRPFMFN